MGYRKRNVRIEFRVTEQERAEIARRMEQAGIINTNAYLRKMAIDGYVVRLDLSELNELVSLLRRCSNNINQLAKHANQTGGVSQAAVQMVRQQLDEVWDGVRNVMSELAQVQ